MGHLLTYLLGVGACLLLEDGSLVLDWPEGLGDIPEAMLEAIRHHKPQLLMRLEAEQTFHLHRYADEARRFAGEVELEPRHLHRAYLEAVRLAVEGRVLQWAGVGLEEFALAYGATSAPVPRAPVELPPDEEAIGERAAIMEHEGGLSRACAEAWARELRHVEAQGRHVAQESVACRLRSSVAFADGAFDAGAKVLVIPAGAPLDGLSPDDAEWLRGRLERLQRLRRDAQNADLEVRELARARLEVEDAFVLVRLGGRVRLLERAVLQLAEAWVAA